MDATDNLSVFLRNFFSGLISEALQKELQLMQDKHGSSTEEQDIVFIEDARRITGLANQTIYQLVSANKIPFLPKNGRKKLSFSRKALLSYMEGRK